METCFEILMAPDQTFLLLLRQLCDHAMRIAFAILVQWWYTVVQWWHYCALRAKTSLHYDDQIDEPIGCKGSLSMQKWTNFRNSFKQPLTPTPSPIFKRENILQNFWVSRLN